MPTQDPSSNKESQLQELRAHLDAATDKAGQHIEEGIKELVLYLNALGIKTAFSCEGHAESGLPAPWVMYAPPDGTNEDAEVASMQEKLACYVDNFNATRDIQSDIALEVVEEYGGYRLSNKGYDQVRNGYLQHTLQEEDLSRLTNLYRSEMDAFADYLKEQWEYQ